MSADAPKMVQRGRLHAVSFESMVAISDGQSVMLLTPPEVQDLMSLLTLLPKPTSSPRLEALVASGALAEVVTAAESPASKAPPRRGASRRAASQPAAAVAEAASETVVAAREVAAPAKSGGRKKVAAPQKAAALKKAAAPEKTAAPKKAAAPEKTAAPKKVAAEKAAAPEKTAAAEKPPAAAKAPKKAAAAKAAPPLKSVAAEATPVSLKAARPAADLLTQGLVDFLREKGRPQGFDAILRAVKKLDGVPADVAIQTRELLKKLESVKTIRRTPAGRFYVE